MTYECTDFDAQCYTISGGNYDISGLTQAIIDIASPDVSLNFYIDDATNIVSISQTCSTLRDVSFIYYDCNDLDCTSTCIGKSYLNQNIGWYLGFRRQPNSDGLVYIDLSGDEVVTGDVPAYVYGPKYCFLTLDDFNKNRLNKGIIGISNMSTKVDLPSYYTPSDVSGCTTTSNCTTNVNIPNVWLSDSTPKTLTNAQLYTIQETLNNRIQRTSRITAPTTPDVLARIPLKNITTLRPEPLILSGTELPDSERTYFGPVDIERIKVGLIDDKGYPLNLHDNDWSFSLTVEQLYQY